MPRQCSACSGEISDDERFQECAACHQSYHLGHRCAEHPHAMMLVISPRLTGRRVAPEPAAARKRFFRQAPSPTGPLSNQARGGAYPLLPDQRGYLKPIALAAVLVIAVAAVVYGVILDRGLPIIGNGDEPPPAGVTTRAAREMEDTPSTGAAVGGDNGSRPTGSTDDADSEAKDAEATRDARLDLAEVKFETESGRLTAESDPAGPVVFSSGVSLRDPMIEVRLHTPIDEASEWDYGIAFRHTGQDQEYRLIMTSAKEWRCILINGDPEQPVSQQSGRLTGVDTQTGEHNDLQLIIVGDTGYFFINDRFVATLDLSEKMERGDVLIGSAFLPEHQSAGQETPYTDFRVAAKGGGE